MHRREEAQGEGRGDLMPAISFQEEWLDRLLSGTKQQTTRPQTSRIKEGDVCSIYNQQRRRITAKPLRKMTYAGIDAMEGRKYPMIPEFHKAMYHAHLLGKVQIMEVYDIHPCEMTDGELKAWAIADGFTDSANLGLTETELADMWFRAHHRDDGWRRRTWTVIRWGGWTERYFEPKVIA